MKYILASLMTLSIVLSMSLTTLSISTASAQTSGDPYGLQDASFDDTLQGSNDLDLKETITKIMKWLFSFLGIIAVLIILYGGFLWMTAAGSDDKIKKAKHTLVNGVIGLIIVLCSYAIATFVFNEIQDQLLNS